MKLSTSKRYGKALDDAYKFGVGPTKNRKYGSTKSFRDIGEAAIQQEDDRWREFENEHRTEREFDGEN